MTSEAVMKDDLTTVLSALHSSDSISADAVRRWMEVGDLRIRGAVYHLLQDARHRIVPHLSTADQCSFMLDYLFDCLLQNPESDDFLHSGFEAAWELAGWVKQLGSIDDAQSLISRIVQRLTAEYVAADEPTRNRIETGAVEHIMESPSLRRHFASWKDDPTLRKAYEDCLLWGQSHEQK
jgi:hypothetical protein